MIPKLLPVSTSSFGWSSHANKRTDRALQANYCSKILNPHLCARLIVRDDTLQTGSSPIEPSEGGLFIRSLQ
jgi:hypothetical protein